MKSYDAGGREREEEEKIVHAKTYEILNDLPVPKLNYILDAYKSHRMWDVAAL